jgi:hypothetical protein
MEKLRVINSAVDDTESFYFSAAEWLLEKDEYAICATDTNLIQRFVIVIFYFETSGNEWRECSEVTSSTCEVYHKELKGDKFLSASHECSWAFIICNSNLQIINLEIGKFLY